ncbi:MAG: DUF87 domain-containing protein, partial [Chloroflexi bacterium]|nr:DUF87 domain-containing protein [Chloroflexota bacterium]
MAWAKTGMRGLIMTILNEELSDFQEEGAEEAGGKLAHYVSEDTKVGDLLSLDYTEAIILVHDSLRQEVGGLPMGCFLFATRVEPISKPNADKEDTSLILLRVLGQAPLPNRIETENWRFDAARRSIDSPQQWDADNKTDQFTLNQLRHAGVRCSVLGTFRYAQNDGRWDLNFGADISNFYSGQGMKVYKPIGETLKAIINFTKPMGESHPLAGKPVPVGRVRYSSSEVSVDREAENVQVNIEPTDMLARRTALFGMSRSGKSNTIKTLASAIFDLRKIDSEKGRIGQLIFDVNGEYANDNPQDEGCLRNINVEDVVTYGLFKHPNDEGRRLIKLNFFGENVQDWSDKEGLQRSLDMLFAGKEIIDEHLRGITNAPQYISRFINTNLEPPDARWGRGQQIRYRRNLTVYRAILTAANFNAPSNLQSADIGGLFSNDLRQAMTSVEDERFGRAATTLGQRTVSWNEFYQTLLVLQEFVISGRQGTGMAEFQTFNENYRNRPNGSGEPWNDDMLNGLLYLLSWGGGVGRIRELQERHEPSVESDYSTEIVSELVNGKLVIVDQSIGSPTEIEHTSDRIMWALFNHQRRVFTDPPCNENGELLRDENGN